VYGVRRTQANLPFGDIFVNWEEKLPWAKTYVTGKTAKNCNKINGIKFSKKTLTNC
jgi:hypothetical protein